MTNLNQYRERIGSADARASVPIYQIQVVNSHFEASNEAEVSSFEIAKEQALRAALQIGTEEVCKGAQFFGAEVRVVHEGEISERFLVSIGQSHLK